MTRDDWRDGAALLIMRLGLAWFIFLWAAHKIITPKQYQGLARHFDGVDVSLAQVYAMGGFQILLCGLAVVGVFRYAAYGGLLIMHFFTVTRRWEKFFDPFALSEKGFPVNRNAVIDLAVLGAMIALILLIRRDHISLGAWFARRRGARRWWM
ncbi:MAG: hypothetical protein AAF360_18745 [Pseudomonadota bacterium]